MASVAQIQANRLNAQKSTGPRTAAGKERASQNALKHGLLAREAVVAGEDPEEFELYREGMLEELAPAGAVEALLAERVVGLAWRLRRAERLQNAAFAALDEGEPTPLLEARLEEWKQLKGSEWDRGIAGVVDENFALGRVVVEDFAGERVLDRLLMYERRIESSLYRTMAELRKERQACVAAGPEGASRSEGRLPAGRESVTPAQLASFGAKVVRSHGQDAHATETPDGVTTNAIAGVPVEEQSCKTNPIAKRVPSLRFQVSSQKGQESSALTSNLALQTSDSPPNTPMDGVACKTNPISSEAEESQPAWSEEVSRDAHQHGHAEGGWDLDPSASGRGR